MQNIRSIACTSISLGAFNYDLVQLAELADEASSPHIGRREISNTLAAICELLGLVELAIPAADGAVLVYVPAKGNNLAGNIEQGLNCACSQYSSRVRLTPLLATDDGLVANVVEKMLVG